MVRVILFEDNKNYGEALQEAFDGSSEIFLSKIFESADKALSRVREYDPDVVLMDIELPPGKSGLDALKEVKDSMPETKVLIQTQFDDDHRIFVALCHGASGYILKSEPFDKIEVAIIDVFKGGGFFSAGIAGKIAGLFSSKMVQTSPDYTPLSQRESEVLSYLGKAYKYREIAETLHISYEGVHSHIKSIYSKLHVNSKSAAVLKAIESKLI